MKKSINIACIGNKINYERFINDNEKIINFIHTDNENKLVGQNINGLIKLSDIDNDIVIAAYSRIRSNYYQ